MRIISRRRLRHYWLRRPDTRTWLENWYRVARHAKWESLEDVRTAFPHADVARVRSGRSATVFNVRGNNHRMIAAIHYNTGRLYVLALMSHAEYDTDQWKETL